MISEEELIAQAEDLYGKLEGRASKDVLLKELKKYVYDYGIEINSARSGIIKKFSAPRSTVAVVSGEAVTKKIADVRGDELNVTVLGKVVDCQKRRVPTKNGDKDIVSGTIADETGSIQFTIWRDDIDIGTGEVYTFSGAYGKKFRDIPQINLGAKGRVIPSDVEITPNLSGSFSGAQSAGIRKKVSELKGDEPNVDMVLKVVTAERRTVTTRSGSERTLVSGNAGDETGTVRFSIWSDRITVEPGKVYEFSKAYCRQFGGQPQLNVGDSGEVKETDADIEVADRPAVQAAELKIGEITESTPIVTVVGKVISANVRTVLVNGEKRSVWGGTLADETGKIQFSSWSDRGIAEGDTYRISNANIRAWRGIPQLNINESAGVEKTDTAVDVQETSPRTVEQITIAGGGSDIRITGTVVDVMAGSGLIKRCPACKRALRDGVCSEHGMVNGALDDLRLKLVLDDGTGAINVVVGRVGAETLSGITLDAALEEARGSGDSSAVSNRIASKVLLKRITVEGMVTTDEKFGPQMNGRLISEEKVDVRAGAEALLKDMEAVM